MSRHVSVVVSCALYCTHTLSLDLPLTESTSVHGPSTSKESERIDDEGCEMSTRAEKRREDERYYKRGER